MGKLCFNIMMKTFLFIDTHMIGGSGGAMPFIMDKLIPKMRWQMELLGLFRKVELFLRGR